MWRRKPDSGELKGGEKKRDEKILRKELTIPEGLDILSKCLRGERDEAQSGRPNLEKIIV
ncbi:hypothetical protein CLI64_28255 [Nostoc sp. CENA543]|nr:hypothetical protein CLI64_28255 [Nostoc sp. CENA543]